MTQSYEIEIRCPKIFHDFSKAQPTEEGEYLIYFANTRCYVMAEYNPISKTFAYEDGECYTKVAISGECTVFWAEIYDISNFIENYLI